MRRGKLAHQESHNPCPVRPSFLVYIRITDRCNMSCQHCMFAATAAGQDMTLHRFKQAIGLVQQIGSPFVIGGGEPTLHPRFNAFLFYAMLNSSIYAPSVVTNGSQTDTALALAKLANDGLIHCGLSLDPWHDPIDPRVIEAFIERDDLPNPGPDQRRVLDASTAQLLPYGRALDNRRTMQLSDESSCLFPGLFIQPDGRMFVCGCPAAPQVGHLRTGFRHDYRIWLEKAHKHECFRVATFSKKMK